MTVSIAIVGGGISGLCLARGLSKYSHLRVTVYEATKEYLDIGGGLAFHSNAMRGLELIDPELQAEYFRRATVMTERDVEMATQVIVGDIPDGEPVLLAELGRAKGRKTIARSDLLAGLLSLVPGVMVKFGKKLEKVEEKSTAGDTGGIELTFQNGSTVKTDVLIGSDGVHSVVRTFLLGKDHPAVGLKNHDGWEWAARRIPAEKANALNDNLLKYVPIICGHGAYMNCMPTHMGKTLNVNVVYGRKLPASVSTSELETKSESKEQPSAGDFAHWTKDARDIATLALGGPSAGWKLADHDPAPFYNRGNICMIGDAAHATMPFNGQGAAQSIEDSCLLTALFEHVEELAQIRQAFKIFDSLRRPRTQKVAEISRQFGRMYAFAEEDVGEDINKMRAIFGAGAKYTNDFDLEAMNRDGVKQFLHAVTQTRQSDREDGLY